MERNRDRNLAKPIFRFQHNRVGRLLCLVFCAGSLSAQNAGWDITASAEFETGASVTATYPVIGQRVFLVHQSLTSNPQGVDKADSAIDVISSANPSVFGQSVTFTAVVSPVAPGAGTPTGTVAFFDGANLIGSGTLSGGVTAFATSSLSVGNHSLSATYNGDGNFNTSTQLLTGNPQVVNKGDTATINISSLDPSNLGQSVTFTATVFAIAPGQGNPTGSISFKDGNTTLGSSTLSDGAATFMTSALSAGFHSITAVYGGDSGFNGSTSAVLIQAVVGADIVVSLTHPPDPVAFGGQLGFLAIIINNGPDSAEVTFSESLSGAQNLVSVSPSAPGSCNQTEPISCTFPVLTGGEAATVLVVVAPTAPGTIVSNASATPDIPDPDTGNNMASDTATVTPADTTTAVASSQNPSTFGESVTFTATVTDSSDGSTAVPTGAVQFVVDGVDFGTPVALTGATNDTSIATSQATATLSVAGSPHTVTANYVNADGNFNNSSGTLSAGQRIMASTSTVLVSSSNPSAFGQSISFIATVTTSAPDVGIPLGTVQFKVDGTNFGTPVMLSSGSATSNSLSSLSVGTHTITAVYSGNASFKTSSATFTQTVNKADSATVVTSSANPSAFGRAVILTATVKAVVPGAGTPSGTMQFKDGTNNLGPPLTGSGTTSFITSSLTPGRHNITAVYSGDTNFNGSTSDILVQSVLIAPLIVKAFGAVSIPSTGTTSLTFTLTNPVDNTDPLTGVTFTDPLPSGLVVATPNGLTNNCGGTPVAGAGLGTISLSGVTLGTNSNCTLIVNVTGTTGGAKNNITTAVTSTNGGTGNRATDSIVVEAAADISVTLTHIPDPAAIGGRLRFIAAVINNGPDKANVTFTETLTGEKYVVSTSTTAGSCSGMGPVNCDLGGMTSNQLAFVTVVVTPLLGRTITANVTVTPSIPDLNNANNNATDTARIRFKPQRF